MLEEREQSTKRQSKQTIDGTFHDIQFLNLVLGKCIQMIPVKVLLIPRRREREEKTVLGYDWSMVMMYAIIMRNTVRYV